jgi:hypothetical protein
MPLQEEQSLALLLPQHPAHSLPQTMAQEFKALFAIVELCASRLLWV